MKIVHLQGYDSVRAEFQVSAINGTGKDGVMMNMKRLADREETEFRHLLSSKV